MNLNKEEVMNLVNSSPFIVSGGDFVAHVIFESITCKAHPTLPRKIDVIVENITELYKREFEKITNDFYLKTFEGYDEILSWMKTNLLAIPEIEELNLSNNEFNSGVKVDDESRGKYAFVSAFSEDPHVDDDFIDLDAFVRNICHDIIKSNINIDFSTFK